MKIYNSGSEISRSAYSQGTRGSTEAGSRPVAATPPISPVGRAGDRVEISDEGRALAAAGKQAKSGDLTPERVSELRQRVLSGAYNSVQVVDEVARRMLDRGDI